MLAALTWTLFTLVAGAFVGYFFGHLARRADLRATTYDAVTLLVAEFKTLLFTKEAPKL
jgi:hypothetical protein